MEESFIRNLSGESVGRGGCLTNRRSRGSEVNLAAGISRGGRDSDHAASAGFCFCAGSAGLRPWCRLQNGASRETVQAAKWDPHEDDRHGTIVSFCTPRFPTLQRRLPPMSCSRFVRFASCYLALQCVLAMSVNADGQDTEQLLGDSGFAGGFIVQLGCQDGATVASLRRGESTQVHGLVRDASKLVSIRKEIEATGVYGDVAVDQFSGPELPYTDNLVNLFVSEDLGEVSLAEVLRVLVPQGVAMIKTGDTWEKTVKPRPENIDEWSHYLHDASGNSVAHDDVVAPPRHLQWVGSPRWARHHDRMASMSALVSTAGRMFYIMDEGSRVSIQLPPKWKLIARDAFNGSILWKRDIPDWQSHLWPLKSGPTQLSRRLVSNDKDWNSALVQSSTLEQEYRVQVEGDLTELEIRVMEAGINLPKMGYFKPLSINVVEMIDGRTVLNVVLTDGKVRQLRRMFSTLRHKIFYLRRVREGNLSTGNLAPGKWRYLTDEEILSIRKLAGPEKK
jgi:pseudouridine synthase